MGALATGGASGGNLTGTGGAGGGGYYGGGAGGTGGRASSGQNAAGGGGGGGSSLVPGGGTLAIAPTTATPSRLTIHYIVHTSVALAAPVVLSDTRALILGSFQIPSGTATAALHYGTTTGYGSVAPISSAYPNGGPAASLLAGLAPATTYHYRLVATSGDAVVDETSDATFTTEAAVAPPQNGADGADGADGVDGVDGVDGADGAQGPTGPIGPVGPAGTTGATGTTGPAGQDAIPTTLSARFSALTLKRGKTGTLGLRVTNTGKGTAPDTELLVMLPNGMTTTSGAKTLAHVKVGTLAAGASKTVTINVKALRNAKRGRVAVNAVLASQTAPLALTSTRVQIG